MPELVVDPIEAILFDMNGTLRMRQAHEPTQRAAAARICELLKKPELSEVDWERLTGRLEAYRQVGTEQPAPAIRRRDLGGLDAAGRAA